MAQHLRGKCSSTGRAPVMLVVRRRNAVVVYQSASSLGVESNPREVLNEPIGLFLKRYINLFFNRYLYVQISPECVTVRDPVTGESISEIPEIAIQRLPTGKETVVAVGAAVRGVASADTRVLNPFAHPRSLVSDFILAEQVLKVFFHRVCGKGLIQPSPLVIVHPLGQHEGGLTQIELRALREMAIGAGARRVRIWEGLQLTDEQVVSMLRA